MPGELDMKMMGDYNAPPTPFGGLDAPERRVARRMLR
jgi:hypothetical protein